MFIIFDKTDRGITSFGVGTPTESYNKLVLGSEVICNNLSVCGWKYISDQTLECDEFGAFVHDADYYPELTPQPTAEERLAAVEQYLLEKELGL